MNNSSNTNTWSIDIPKEPTSCIVIIKNISIETKEATIKDFFSFCGVIKVFEMKLDAQDTQHQIAIVYFEKESAAKTATLLSQAVVDDSSIEVEPYFMTNATTGVNSDNGGEPMNNSSTEKVAQQQQQETKSVSHIMAELLASGYVLTESVINKGTEFDQKHGVSTTVNGYLNKMGINLTQLNQRFYGSKSSTSTVTPETVTDHHHNNPINAQTGTNTRSVTTDNSSTTSNSRMQNILGSRAGLRVQGIASRVAGKVSTVHEEAKRIAAEKKNNNNSLSKETSVEVNIDDHKLNTTTSLLPDNKQ